MAFLGFSGRVFVGRSCQSLLNPSFFSSNLRSRMCGGVATITQQQSKKHHFFKKEQQFENKQNRFSLLGNCFRSSFCTVVDQGEVVVNQHDLKDSDFDPNHLITLENKKKLREKQKYYTHFSPSITLSNFQKEYDSIDKGQVLQDTFVRVSGRVKGVREAGTKMVFIDIVADSRSAKVQIISTVQRLKDPEHFALLKSAIKRGDIIAVEGNPGRSKVGELSVFASSLTLLAPCSRRLPDQNSLLDPELRVRERALDMIVNDASLSRVLLRSSLIRNLRAFLDNRGFVEVETPILATSAGGANAVPFETNIRSLSLPLFLRISPELYLKQMVIGGIEKVYEIGKQFRNEGIDARHNPEFTTCEFYSAFSDYEDLMGMTEELLCTLATQCTGSPHIQWKDETLEGEEEKKETLIDFTPPYRRVHVWKELERCVGPLPSPENLDSTESRQRLEEVITEHNIPISNPKTPARMIDKLISHFIEPNCVQPTFLYAHPLIMSPLAREQDVDDQESESEKENTKEKQKGLVDRFELIVAKQELINAYSELSDPVEQRRRFEMQVQQRLEGDEESQDVDENYIGALEYGFPPTAGWGLGVDRLVMLLSGVHHIRDVLSFPLARPRE